MADGDRPRPSRIVIRIDELILDGVAPGDRYAIADAVRNALAEQLERSGAGPSWNRGTHIERIDAGECRLPRRAGAGTLGSRIGETIYRGISTWPNVR
jgi:hypothetical protein